MRLGCLVIVGLSLLAGCHTGPPPPPPELRPDEEAKLHASFDEARAAMAEGDAKGWTEEACRTTAATFEELADRLADHDREGSLAARYDQGLALARCQLHAEAAAAFEALLARAPGHHRAKVQLTLHRLEQKGPAYLSDAIAVLTDAILVEEFLARGAPEQAKPKLLEAKELYASFAERAEGKPTMKAAGERAAERVRDIDQQLSFLQEQP